MGWGHACDLFRRQSNREGGLLWKAAAFLSGIMKLVNILIPLRKSDVKKIRSTLRRRRFEFAERDYGYFTAKRGRLHVTIYEKGPKALVQGNEAEEFAGSVLEPMVTRAVVAVNDL